MSDPIDPDLVANAAQLLTAARKAVQYLPDLGDHSPTTETAAYEIADIHATQLELPVSGWKVGCTSEEAMRILKAPGPFAGRVFEDTVFDGTSTTDGVEISNALFPNSMLECEFAFMLGDDLPPRDRPYSVDEVRDATVSVAPTFELVGPRFQEMTSVHYKSLIADSGANAGAVLGIAVPVDQVPDLASLSVRIEVDGEEQASGTGADILGDPWNALAWLANHLSSRGSGLRSGQFVLSGTCTGITPLAPGSSARSDYGALGQVQVSRPA